MFFIIRFSTLEKKGGKQTQEDKEVKSFVCRQAIKTHKKADVDEEIARRMMLQRGEVRMAVNIARARRGNLLHVFGLVRFGK